MFADIGYEETETKGLVGSQERYQKLIIKMENISSHIGWNQINIVKESKILKDI